jgi:hypothetical protein
MSLLQNSAMLVHLSISNWTARKYDRKATNEVHTNYNAKDAGNFNKLLIFDDRLKTITKTISAIRVFHYTNTLPWNDGGYRLLPSKNYLNYQTNLQALKRDFVEAVHDFIYNYEDMKYQAKNNLNGLYNEKDYPSVSKLEKKFDMDIEIIPIEDSAHFVLQVSQEEEDFIRKDIELRTENRFTAAINDIIKRFDTAVNNIYQTMIEPEKIFRDSLFNNLSSLIELSPSLNFSNDKRIDYIVRNCKPLLSYTPTEVRISPDRRIGCAADAKAALTVIELYTKKMQ